ncbi:MAG TPA: RluA family pseudouridine synthase [Bacteroidales bacterium]|jgi:23S rRNA pseudouridine1911/1915/1917 synthase|nr:RluA family pseudouridine synthase [Bacteroidales bacterium]
MKNSILYEDNHLIIINKKSGEIVQGDKTGDESLIDKVKSYLKNTYQKQGNVFCGLVHRVDRPVSGIVIFAKTSKALSRMNAIFKEQKIQKFYWAIVKNKPQDECGTLVHYLKKNENLNKSFAVNSEKKGYQRAELIYTYLLSSEHYHLLEIELITGRHHQIRVQLSAIGSTIKGDLKYGYPRSNSDASISLHARTVKFTHPVSNIALTIEAPLPKDSLWMYFEEKMKEKNRL